MELLLAAGADLSVEISEVGGALDYALIGRHEAMERCSEDENFDGQERWDRLIEVLESAPSSSEADETTISAKNRVVAEAELSLRRLQSQRRFRCLIY